MAYDVEEIGLVVDVSCIDWMIRMSRELYLSMYSWSSLCS
jgi:adenine deaminase